MKGSRAGNRPPLFTRFIIFFSLLFSAIPCTTQNPVDENYYSENSRIYGGAAPAKVTLSPFSLSDPVLRWSESIDPDTAAPVNKYVVYYYYGSLPVSEDEYFLSEDILTLVENSLSLSMQGVTFGSGTHYFCVTAYDGGRESEVSNFVSVTVN